ncbi:hypothetical protein TWF481_002742 [Arthrobotrys musiformis]|uniref:Uncharacterized protein n=1 Tax=Arthrobotrys musiformis TaxID=47236 RepID=A0AAV9VT46_9PEZI
MRTPDGSPRKEEVMDESGGHEEDWVQLGIGSVAKGGCVENVGDFGFGGVTQAVVSVTTPGAPDKFRWSLARPGVVSQE